MRTRRQVNGREGQRQARGGVPRIWTASVIAGISAIAVLATASVAPAAISIFEDDFDDGNYDGWTVNNDAYFDASSGYLEWNTGSTSPQKGTAQQQFTGYTGRQWTFTCNFRMRDDTHTGEAQKIFIELWGKQSDGSLTYGYKWKLRQTAQVLLTRSWLESGVGWHDTDAWGTTETYADVEDDDPWDEFKMVFDDGVIEAYLNNEKILGPWDDTASAGNMVSVDFVRLGNYSTGSWFGDGGQVDDVLLVPEPATLGLLSMGGLAVLVRRRRR